MLPFDGSKESEVDSLKLYAIYSEYNEKLKDEWFLPSLTGEFELHIEKADCFGGNYGTNAFREAVLEKSNLIINAIKENMSETFVYSDVDIQYFKPIKSLLLDAIVGHDIVCQRDEPRAKGNQLCTGFFIIRANNGTLKLWERVRKAVRKEGRDQLAFNRILNSWWYRQFSYPRIKYNFLSDNFFSAGTLTGENWQPGQELVIPDDIVLHHANWTVGIENKISQLEYVKRCVESRLNSKE